jgi:hypothetical protein
MYLRVICSYGVPKRSTTLLELTCRCVTGQKPSQPAARQCSSTAGVQQQRADDLLRPGRVPDVVRAKNERTGTPWLQHGASLVN